MHRPLRTYDECTQLTRQLIDLDNNLTELPKQSVLKKRIEKVCFACGSSVQLRNCSNHKKWGKYKQLISNNDQFIQEILFLQ